MYRTAEFVTPKHPDKLCDQVSDAILDICLKDDSNSRVAVETMGGHGLVYVTGEITTKATPDIRKAVKSVVGNDISIQLNIVKQSEHIAGGVDTGGAGDQGIMIGYACNENPALIPQEAFLARSLCRYIYKEFPVDGKTQITLKDNKIIGIVASFVNTKKADLKNLIIDWAVSLKLDIENSIIYANPAGDWSNGGFEADTGLTGRKLAVDNYGPRIPLGGGAFSGKDATKVDRSAAYMARKIAVDYLRKFNADEVFVRLAYAIGIAYPMEATAIVDGKEFPVSGYNLTPKGIIEYLDLNKPIYQETAKWGHFGNGFNWDR
jgi:S-adenosylmethionine synthetase